MWYSDKFWSDVTNTELRARWNAKLAREGWRCKAEDSNCDDLESDFSFNQHYRIPAKPRSNVHYCAGTLQAGYATPDSFKEYQTSKAASRMEYEAAKAASRLNNGSSSIGRTRRSSDSGSEASYRSQQSYDSQAPSLVEVTDGAYLFAPSCGYFRIGQLNPMNNNSAQFSCCNQHKIGMNRYEGYDWRFHVRVKNIPATMRKTLSDAQLLTEVADVKKEALDAKAVRLK